MYDNTDVEYQAFLSSLGDDITPAKERSGSIIYREGYESDNPLAAETHDFINCPCWRCGSYRKANGIEWPPVAGPYDDEWPG
jgi:hypothetical protein